MPSTGELKSDPIDCLIVGGGPAGLTAAIYAARFRLRVVVADAGGGRARAIPRSLNHAGFPDGIPGAELVERMQAQAVRWGAELRSGKIARIAAAKGGFQAEGQADPIEARTVLIATGVTNHAPAMAADLHARALAQGRLRYCPVCDAMEVSGQKVAVIGSGEHGAREALFLRSYTPHVALVCPHGAHDLDADQRGRLEAAGVELLQGPVGDFRLAPDGLGFRCGDGERRFEAVYPAMGSQPHSQLAADLGAAVTEDGCIKVDAHQRTSVAGLYAAGDVVIGLDQISHAMGQAGVAATAIRNDLALAGRLWR